MQKPRFGVIFWGQRAGKKKVAHFKNELCNRHFNVGTARDNDAQSSKFAGGRHIRNRHKKRLKSRHADGGTLDAQRKGDGEITKTDGKPVVNAAPPLTKIFHRKTP